MTGEKRSVEYENPQYVVRVSDLKKCLSKCEYLMLHSPKKPIDILYEVFGEELMG